MARTVARWSWLPYDLWARRVKIVARLRQQREADGYGRLLRNNSVGCEPLISINQLKSRSVGVLTILLLIGSWSLLSAQSPPDLSAESQAFVQEHFRNAKHAEATQDFSQAENEYRLILSKFPTQVPGAYQNLGLDYYLQRRYVDAVATFSSGIKLDPTMLGAQLFLGSSYLYLNQPEKALPHLKYAYRASPTTEAATYLGLAYHGMDEFTTATPFFKRALDTAAQDKDNYLYLLGDNYLQLANQTYRDISDHLAGSLYDHLLNAEVLESQRWLQAAAREYLYAATMEPLDAAVFYPFARVLAELGLQAPAQLAFARYRELAPTDTNATIDVPVLPKQDPADVGLKVDYVKEIGSLPPIRPSGLPLLSLMPAETNEALRVEVRSDKAGNWKRAVDELCKGSWTTAIDLLRKCPPGANGRLRDYLMAKTYTWNHEYQEAEDAIDRSLLSFPSAPEVQLLRWEVAHQLSINYLNRLLEEYPDSGRSHFVRAKAYIGQGKLPEAVTEYQAAAQAGADRLGVHLALGDLFRSDSRLPEALEEYQKELVADPYSEVAKAMLGRTYLEMREPEKAIAALQEVLKSDPKNGPARADLAASWNLLGNTQVALKEYQTALQMDPSLNHVHYVLGTIYRKLGQPEAMKREFHLFQEGEAKKHQQILQRVPSYLEATGRLQ